MSDSIESLRRKIEGATQLESVVCTMKALAASNIGQYERAVASLNDYYLTVQLGISACLRQSVFSFWKGNNHKGNQMNNIVVFGSDQGLVGQFNEQLAMFVIEAMANINGEKSIWTVGERIQSRLDDAGYSSKKTYEVPNSVNAITPLINQILLDTETLEKKITPSLYIFHHRPKSGSLFEPISQRLLPLDMLWQENFKEIKWTGKNLPQVIGETDTLQPFIHEYLFVSLFKSCAESLASENASRMASMQRAEKNIGELLDDFNRSYHRLRQNGIDEELFDVVAGFEALNDKEKKGIK